MDKTTDLKEMDIVEWLIKASQAIYLATDASVADDISPRLKQAAAEITSLRSYISEHEDAHD